MLRIGAILLCCACGAVAGWRATIARRAPIVLDAAPVVLDVAQTREVEKLVALGIPLAQAVAVILAHPPIEVTP